MELILQVFYSVFSGILLAAAIPNELYLFGCPIFTLVALVPYYLVFNKIKNYKQAFLAGFLQAISTHLISSFWLAYFKDFAAMTLGASAFGTGMIGGFLALLIYLPFSSSRLKNSLNRANFTETFLESSGFRILYFAALYTIYEWVKSSGFLGYPWGTISSAIFKWPVLMQLSAITGTYGITILIAALNALIAEVYLYFTQYNTNKKNQYFVVRQSAILLSLLFLSSLVYGLYQYDKARTPEKILTTVLVQQNSDPWKNKTDTETILLSEDLTDKTISEAINENKTVDLVVWSEGCLKRMFPNSEVYYRYYPEEKPLLEYIKQKKLPFIIGGAYARDAENQKFFNASILFDSEGNFRGCYGKNHLVPFAESLPFIEYPKIKEIMQKVIGISASWTPGDQYVYFDVPCKTTEEYSLPAVKNIDLTKQYLKYDNENAEPVTVRLSTPICFDDAFTDIMRPMFLNGAELFINITDDSWSLKKSSEIQHFAIASYRAIEYRTTLVRSANAGYSVIVTPSGKVIHDMPLFEATSGVFDVPVFKREITTYARFGNWLPYTLIFMFFIYTVYYYLTFRNNDYIPSERKIKNKKNKKHKKNKK